MGSIDLQTSFSLKRLIEVPKLKAVVSRESEPQMFRKLFESLNNFFMHTLCCDNIKFFSQSESALSLDTTPDSLNSFFSYDRIILPTSISCSSENYLRPLLDAPTFRGSVSLHSSSRTPFLAILALPMAEILCKV